MNEHVIKRMQRTADILLKSPSSPTVTILVGTGKGVYDETRGVYSNGIEWTPIYNIPCLMERITGGMVRFGRWGYAVEGDVIFAFDRNIPFDEWDTFKIVYNNNVYKPVAPSDVTAETLSGILGNTQLFRVIHCRLEGR